MRAHSQVKEEIEGDLEDMLSNIEKTGRGVYVQASTLGSLEALLEFLRTSQIPVPPPFLSFPYRPWMPVASIWGIQVEYCVC